VGAGIGYTAKNRRWRTLVTSSYGIDAIRSTDAADTIWG